MVINGRMKEIRRAIKTEIERDRDSEKFLTSISFKVKIKNSFTKREKGGITGKRETNGEL